MQSKCFKCIDRSNWIPDELSINCMLCKKEFSVLFRRHHCRLCGTIACGNCSDHKLPTNNQRMVRVCNRCFANVVKSSIKQENDPNHQDTKISPTLPTTVSMGIKSTLKSANNTPTNSPSTSTPSSYTNSTMKWKKSVLYNKSDFSNIRSLFGMKWNRGRVLTEDELFQMVKDDIKAFEIEYNQLRDSALDHLKQRDECYKKSIDVQKINEILSKELLDKGKHHHNQMDECNWKAARMIFSLRNPQLLIEDNSDSSDSSDTEDEDEPYQQHLNTDDIIIKKTTQELQEQEQDQDQVLIIDLYGLLPNESFIIFKERIQSLLVNLSCNSIKKLNIINIGESVNTIKDDQSRESLAKQFVNQLQSDNDLKSVLCNITQSTDNLIVLMDLNNKIL
ncbi:pleckstrin (PH) domain-containing protein [Tieghemostelium lacteum]|uniref:Pleckstrin (PH) domain-containing protein n=1 Tax=Tieghemostelium lacteum TaxID=361077 RepID=A0A152A990_TIELA|nr:pleckstrin (PH) domain-containing protein [Tieghemostelium lacteum]|eukprot:KYR02788.1 pleckstrin (PH) domain-containing protein [Tieghemostelium lacteum]